MPPLPDKIDEKPQGTAPETIVSVSPSEKAEPTGENGNRVDNAAEGNVEVKVSDEHANTEEKTAPGEVADLREGSVPTAELKRTESGVKDMDHHRDASNLEEAAHGAGNKEGTEEQKEQQQHTEAGQVLEEVEGSEVSKNELASETTSETVEATTEDKENTEGEHPKKGEELVEETKEETEGGEKLVKVGEDAVKEGEKLTEEGEGIAEKVEGTAEEGKGINEEDKVTVEAGGGIVEEGDLKKEGSKGILQAGEKEIKEGDRKETKDTHIVEEGEDKVKVLEGKEKKQGSTSQLIKEDVKTEAKESDGKSRPEKKVGESKTQHTERLSIKGSVDTRSIDTRQSQRPTIKGPAPEGDEADKPKFVMPREGSAEEEDIGDFTVRSGSGQSPLVLSLRTIGSEDYVSGVGSGGSNASEMHGSHFTGSPMDLLPRMDPEVRLATINRYKTLAGERRTLRRRNAILMKHLIEYFKKRKLETAYKKLDTPHPETVRVYNKRLLIFEETFNIEQREKKAITEELRQMKERRDKSVAQMTKTFNHLLQRERDVGVGLVNIKTGVALSQAMVDSMISKQMEFAKDLHDIRFRYFKGRDKVIMKEKALKLLDNIGEGLHLLDYEQLRVENQNYAEKLDERNEELIILQKRTTAAIQSVAHIREKSNATLNDIDDVYAELEEVEYRVNSTREYISKVKKRRDHLRLEIQRMRKESSLLTNTRLLRHFEDSIKESERIAADLRNVKDTYRNRKQSLIQIRKTIDRFTTQMSERAVTPATEDNIEHELLPLSGSTQTPSIESKYAEELPRNNILLRTASTTSRQWKRASRVAAVISNDTDRRSSSFYQITRVKAGKRPSFLPRRLSSTNFSFREFGNSRFSLPKDVPGKDT